MMLSVEYIVIERHTEWPDGYRHRRQRHVGVVPKYQLDTGFHLLEQADKAAMREMAGLASIFHISGRLIPSAGENFGSRCG
jgi:hypothetical protein